MHNSTQVLAAGACPPIGPSISSVLGLGLDQKRCMSAVRAAAGAEVSQHMQSPTPDHPTTLQLDLQPLEEVGGNSIGQE